MFRHGRQQPLIATLPPPGPQERRPRRGQSPALGLSLLVNVALLLLMAYHGFVGGRGSIEQQPAVATQAVAAGGAALEAAGGGASGTAAAAGWASQGSAAAAEELLEGIHTDAAVGGRIASPAHKIFTSQALRSAAAAQRARPACAATSYAHHREPVHAGRPCRACYHASGSTSSRQAQQAQQQRPAPQAAPGTG